MIHATLIDPRTLRQYLHTPGWRIFDCRFDLGDPMKGEQAYCAGHLPGAEYAHLDRDLSGPITTRTGRHPLPSPDLLAHWLGTRGVDATTQVVVYDDAQGAMAVRLWWMLKWLGHAPVALLDGGWQAWLAADLPIDTRRPSPPSTTLNRTHDDACVIETSALENALARNAIRLIDVRTRPRFRGEHEPIDPVAGHIPGAVNLPYLDHLGPDGRFLDRDSLRRLYSPLLAGHATDTVTFMCGSGVTACHGVLALEHAGIGRARLYPGSWSEWICDPSRAIAIGAGSGAALTRAKIDARSDH
ncbi:MAG: sulfurtransferase [Thiotrichales bacterium]